MRHMISNIVIFLAGLAVYAGYGLAGFGYLAAAVVLSYAAGRLMPRYPWMMWVSAVTQGLMLVAVKLQPVTGMELISVMGISYFTLKILSYHADLYRGKYPPETNFLRYALYVTYMPQMFLGPIERYDMFKASAFESRKIHWDGISGGAARAIWGLFKKLVVAARAGVLVATISGDPETYRGAYAMAAMVLYYVQLYADFSGGIDMVIGVSRMLGIGCSENFDAPYLAESVQEFWRRWHMTLGSWLKDYVYIPLGGNRKGAVRKVLNNLAAFLVSGLWHGVHYVLWGALNGICVVFGSKCKTRSRLLNQVMTFLVISLLWAFYVWPDTLLALEMMGTVFTTFNYGAFFGGILELGLNLGEWIVLVLGVVTVWTYDLNRERIAARFGKLCPAGRVAMICSLGLIVLVFGMYGIGFEVDSFIYSRF